MRTPQARSDTIGGRSDGLPPKPPRPGRRSLDPPALSQARLHFLVLAAGTFGLDRLTKAEVLAGVQPGERIVVLPWLSIADVQNAGGAYGFGQAATLLWLGASLVVGAGIILYVLRRPIGLPSGLALGLVLGGTLGNGYSRLVNGSVTDFLALAGWPVFNVADLAVVAGVVLLLLRWRRNGRRAR